MAADRTNLLREILDQWASGNFRARRDLFADDVESIWGEPPGDDVVARGQQEVAKRFGEFLANWRDFKVVPEELIQVDDEHVLVVAIQRGKGIGSGVEIEARVHIVFKFAEEKITGTYWFFERAKALRLAGLPEQAT